MKADLPKQSQITTLRRLRSDDAKVLFLITLEGIDRRTAQTPIVRVISAQCAGRDHCVGRHGGYPFTHITTGPSTGSCLRARQSKHKLF